MTYSQFYTRDNDKHFKLHQFPTVLPKPLSCVRARLGRLSLFSVLCSSQIWDHFRPTNDDYLKLTRWPLLFEKGSSPSCFVSCVHNRNLTYLSGHTTVVVLLQATESINLKRAHRRNICVCVCMCSLSVSCQSWIAFWERLANGFATIQDTQT